MEAWKSHTKHDAEGTKDEFNVHQSRMKALPSRKINTELSEFDECGKLCTIGQNATQINE